MTAGREDLCAARVIQAVRNADAIAELMWEAKNPFLANKDVPVHLGDPRVRSVLIPVEEWRKVMAAVDE